MFQKQRIMDLRKTYMQVENLGMDVAMTADFLFVDISRGRWRGRDEGRGKVYDCVWLGDVACMREEDTLVIHNSRFPLSMIIHFKSTSSYLSSIL